MKLFFRALVQPQYGLGHLKRCLVLANVFKQAGHETCFLMPENSKHAIHIITASYHYVEELPKCIELNEEVHHYPDDCSYLILDMCNVHYLRSTDAFGAYASALIAKHIFVVFIDGLFKEACRLIKMPILPVYVQPYLGAELDTEPKAKHWLKGAEYALLNHAYSCSPEKHIKTRAENILITLGGADPFEVTLTAMASLLNLDAVKQVRVIIGPCFDSKLRCKIENIAHQWPEKFCLFYNVENMLEHYLWADIALSSSGMTRYEFAASGLPSICVALYEEHVKGCRIFDKFGICSFIGLFRTVSIQSWHNAVSGLIDNIEKRLEMSISGRALIDGRGASRLVNKLLEVFEYETRD